MQYINPAELLNLVDANDGLEINSDVIKKAKRRFLADIDLSDDGHYKYHGIELTKGECENAIEQFSDKKCRAFYLYLVSDKELNNFLINGYDGNYYAVKTAKNDIPFDNDFIKFVSPFFTPKFDKALLRAFDNGDEIDLKALLKSAFLIAPNSLNTAYRSISADLQNHIADIKTIVEEIKKEESIYDEDDVHEVIELVKEYFPAKLLNTLPAYFQSQINNIAEEINFLGIAIWENIAASQVCEDLAAHVLSLNETGLSRPIFEGNFNIYKEKNESEREQAKYAPTLTKYARFVILAKEKKAAVESKNLYPAALLEWVNSAVYVPEVSQLPQAMEEIKNQVALSLRALSVAVWNTHSNIEVAVMLIQQADAVAAIKGEIKKNIEEAKRQLLEIKVQRQLRARNSELSGNATSRYTSSSNSVNNSRKTHKSNSTNSLILFMIIGFVVLFFLIVFKSCDSDSEYSTNKPSIETPQETLTSITPTSLGTTNSTLIVPSSPVDPGVHKTPSILLESKYKGNHLKNGASPLSSCFGKSSSGGSAYITFDNSNSTDAIVCLVNYSTQKTIRNEYIQAGAAYTMRSIPTGTYFLKVYYGKDWNPAKENFCGAKGAFESEVHFSKSDNAGDLIQVENSNFSYTTGRITLYSVPNGNMSVESMGESEFFNQ